MQVRTFNAILFVMRRAIFRTLKLSCLLSCLILISACTLPLLPPETERPNIPEPIKPCQGVCEICLAEEGCGIKLAKSCCPWCTPKSPCETGSALEWAVSKKKAECDSCDLAALERRLNDLRCQFEEGCVYSAVCLGHLYLVGDKCLCPDLSKAVCWYQRAAEGGVTLAMVQMGHFYRDGICLQRNATQAALWYEKAACCGDISAMIALGELYKGWHGMKPNFKKAIYWYEQAMCRGSVEGEFQVGLLLAKGVKGECKINEGLCMIGGAVDIGNPDAVSAYGDLYFEGKLGPRNLQLAYEYYLAAAERGSLEGAYKLGMMYMSGVGLKIDAKEASKWIGIAAEGGLPSAELYMAKMYQHGWGLKRDVRIAGRWYYKAGQSGIISSYVEIADMYHSGRGMPRILEEAAKFYQMASDSCEHPYASLMLSVMYEMGRGVPFDLSRAVGYYKRAEKEHGFLLAVHKVGKRFANGFGLPKDMERALYWYTLAANRGLPIAQIELGDLFYSGGDGILPDFDVAFKWYHKAAVQGSTYAQNMVGLMWLQDKCIPKNVSPAAAALIVQANEKRAACWIEKAAKHGARQAQYQLGLLYWQGIGVPQSDEKAYAWIRNALQDMEDATPTEIVELVKDMTPEMKALAVQLTEEYRHKYSGLVDLRQKKLYKESHGLHKKKHHGLCK